jgi:hypothetical protein
MKPPSAKNAIWRLHFRAVRCHTADQKTHTRLLAMAGAILANVHFVGRRRTAWDIDLPADKIRIAERLLGVVCDESSTCHEVGV